MNNRDDKIKESNLRLSIKKVLMSLQRKKEEMSGLDNDINSMKKSNQDKEEEIAQLKDLLNKKKETFREEKRKQLIGNKTLDSLNMMIKYDRKDSNITDKEYFETTKKRTELLNATYRAKYSELEDLFRIYSELSMKRKIIEVKTNTII